MKTLYVLPLLVASGFFAASEANALTLDNGRNINGVALQGTAETAGVAKAVTVILQDGEHVTLN